MTNLRHLADILVKDERWRRGIKIALGTTDPNAGDRRLNHETATFLLNFDAVLPLMRSSRASPQDLRTGRKKTPLRAGVLGRIRRAGHLTQAGKWKGFEPDFLGWFLGGISRKMG